MNTTTPISTDTARRYGPWAVVTGASDGIGREFAAELARRGLNLVLVARREPLLQALGDGARHRPGDEGHDRAPRRARRRAARRAAVLNG